MTYAISKFCPDMNTVRWLHQRYEKNQVFEGRNRNVFLLNRCVVKIPKNADGFTDNDWEGSISNSLANRDNEDFVQYPQKRLVYINDVPVLFMEIVTPINWDYHKWCDFPKWIDRVDCGQVGYTKKNRLVAFDYGPR